MKLSKRELFDLMTSVALDSARQISIRNHDKACCGGYCSGTCCTSNNSRN